MLSMTLRHPPSLAGDRPRAASSARALDRPDRSPAKADRRVLRQVTGLERGVDAVVACDFSIKTHKIWNYHRFFTIPTDYIVVRLSITYPMLCDLLTTFGIRLNGRTDAVQAQRSGPASMVFRLSCLAFPAAQAARRGRWRPRRIGPAATSAGPRRVDYLARMDRIIVNDEAASAGPGGLRRRP